MNLGIEIADHLPSALCPDELEWPETMVGPPRFELGNGGFEAAGYPFRYGPRAGGRPGTRTRTGVTPWQFSKLLACQLAKSSKVAERTGFEPVHV